MLPFDAATLRAEAKNRNFQPGWFEKAVRLLHLLQEIGQDSLLGPGLSLHGGTGINLFYLKCPRLSVDADLSYIRHEGADEMVAARPEVEKRLKEIAQSQGYEPEPIQKKYGLGSFKLPYLSVHDTQDFIKVEINYLMRVPLGPVEIIKAHSLLEGIEWSFPVAAKDEVYGGKVKAFLQRTAERDMFDVNYLIKNGQISTSSPIRYFATFFLANDQEGADTWSTSRMTWPRRTQFLSGINPMVRPEDRVRYEDVRPRVEGFARSILDWDLRQKAFLKAVSDGQPGGRELFPKDAEMASRIDRHPVTKWRLRKAELDASEPPPDI